MRPGSVERGSSYLGRSWARLGIPIGQEVSRGHSREPNPPTNDWPCCRQRSGEGELEGPNVNRRNNCPECNGLKPPTAKRGAGHCETGMREGKKLMLFYELITRSDIEQGKPA